MHGLHNIPASEAGILCSPVSLKLHVDVMVSDGGVMSERLRSDGGEMEEE